MHIDIITTSWRKALTCTSAPKSVQRPLAGHGVISKFLEDPYSHAFRQLQCFWGALYCARPPRHTKRCCASTRSIQRPGTMQSKRLPHKRPMDQLKTCVWTLGIVKAVAFEAHICQPCSRHQDLARPDSGHSRRPHNA